MSIEDNLVFLGSKQAGLDACRTIIENISRNRICAIVCPDDRADQRSELIQFKSLANLNDIPFFTVGKTVETVELLKKINPSVVLVHGWYQMLPVENFSNILFLGFHYSSLPKYRGNAPLVWQIINGESQIGVSFFKLTAGMDEGALIDQRFFSLTEEENIADALQKAGDLVHTMLLDFLNNWGKKGISMVPQNSETPSYCGLRQPDDGRIDWNRDSEDVYNFIRAQSKPYPGAFCLMPDGQRLTIWKAVKDDRVFYGVPGSVVDLTPNDVTIACENGSSIMLKEIQAGENYFCNPGCV